MSQQINLCNPLFRKQEKYFSAATMIQSLIIILVGALLFYAYLQYQYRDLVKQTQQMSQRQTEAQQQLTQAAATMGIRKPSQQLIDNVAAAERALHAQQVILDLLKTGDMGNQTGFSAYFQALSRQTVHGLWLTGFDVTGTGSQISLNGRALQAELISQFINKLKKEPQFIGANFTTFEISQPKPATASNTDTPPPNLPYVNFSLTNIMAEPAK